MSRGGKESTYPLDTIRVNDRKGRFPPLMNTAKDASFSIGATFFLKDA